MNINRFIVVMTEHSDSFDDVPRLLNSFETREEADSFVEMCVLESCKEFTDEEEVETGLVQTFNEDGTPKYGCIWTVIDTEDAKKARIREETPLTGRTEI